MKWKNFQLACFISVMISLIFISSLSFPVVAAETITLNPIADTYVDSYHPSTNYGGSIFLNVEYSNLSFMDNTERDTYLKFNLTALSTDLFAINSATLELYGYHAGLQTSQVGVYSCADTQWNEIELTWENAPSFSSEPIDVAPVAFTDTWYSWDVTDEVKNSQEGYITLVMAIVSKADIYSSGFSSKETFSNHPRLVIEYEAIPEFPSYTLLLAALTMVAVAGILYKKKLNR